ncbi:hypothetical protein [Thermococcus sp. M36]|uniref:hypothetical protein n=1 Tax=Thermococcus sp. M36 TaxID=1638261 RepID=UPI001F0F1B30|nr:hypothetical protein [Thermococcus sp. M36]
MLTWAGLGSFLGFAVAAGLYSPRGGENYIYLIYVGLALGLAAGAKYPVRTRASAYAFPIGFMATSILAGLWMVKSTAQNDIYAFLAVVAVVLVITGSSGFLDMFLTPITYFGGFVLAMLVFRGYQPLQGSEGAVMGLFMVGVMGSILAFLAVFSRWLFEASKSIVVRR